MGTGMTIDDDPEHNRYQVMENATFDYQMTTTIQSSAAVGPPDNSHARLSSAPTSFGRHRFDPGHAVRLQTLSRVRRPDLLLWPPFATLGIRHGSCARAGIPLGEVPVEWTEIDGSKLHTSPWSLIQVSLDMLRDMLCVRLCYALGIWKIRQQAQQDISRRRGDGSEARRKAD